MVIPCTSAMFIVADSNQISRLEDVTREYEAYQKTGWKDKDIREHLIDFYNIPEDKIPLMHRSFIKIDFDKKEITNLSDKDIYIKVEEKDNA